MSKVSGAVYVCIKQFKARLGDELNLLVGDKIEVLADDSEYNDGWYMGRNIENEKVGLFPKSFTKLAVEPSPQGTTLLRSRSRRVPSSKLANSSNNNDSANTTVNNVGDSDGASAAATKPTQTSNEVSSTMSEIDKALQELQVSSLDPARGHLRNPSAQSLTQDLNPLKVADWTPKQVSSYFAIVLGFDMGIAGKFARHKITGEILLELDLAHLKELDIDSFGTRFEVYKEIEKLKQIASRANPNRAKADKSLKSVKSEETEDSQTPKEAPQPVSKPSTEALEFASYNNSDEDRTEKPPVASNDGLLPSANFGKKPAVERSLSVLRHQRTRSQSLENLYSTPPLFAEKDQSFMSPRKAPEPPVASPMNKNFKFGGSPATPSNNFNAGTKHGLYMTRTNASSAALGSHGALRPALSVYDNSVMSHHRQGSSGVNHKRHSSVFLFLSGANEENQTIRPDIATPTTPGRTLNKRALRILGSDLTQFEDHDNDAVDIDEVGLSPEKAKTEKAKNPQGRLKSLRSVSTQNFRSLTGLRKLKTSAFQEGIRDINPDDAIKSSNFSGWMSKKSGLTLGWRLRYFTLHGTRLSYFTSLRDKREKGLIDITAHKVIPISTEGDSSGTNDKYIALYAALTGFGRFCFKLVPPAPGFKKGLTFTQPKTHFFAVETQEEMRGWLKALMTATIDIDDSVPVVSSCNTPTVTLAQAQELLAKAREETKLKDEELRAQGYIRDGDFGEASANTLYNDSATSEEPSPIVGSMDETTISSSTAGTPMQPKLVVDTQMKLHRPPNTPQMSSHSGGFASPYLLASGVLSPKLNHANGTGSATTTPQFQAKKDYFDASPAPSTPSVTQEQLRSSSDNLTVFANSNGRVLSGPPKKKALEKLMAYTSDGSFVIKSKK